jgi:hypothetical protein
MPEFLHELPEARELFETLASTKHLDPFLVEKDYWVMHCLWGLQRNQQLHFEMKGGTSLSKGWCCIDRFSEDIDIRFDPPPGLNTHSNKERHITARFQFYDELAKSISIPDIVITRDTVYDDKDARNGGIRLTYHSHFSSIAGLSAGVLLEVGFDKTAPNEPKDFTSWAMQKAFEVKMKIYDNRAPDVKCFNPEYTFIDKLQTVCRRFRLYKERMDSTKDRPREFLRHYYDLYKLLELNRVTNFIGTEDYKNYKNQKLAPNDLRFFNSRDPFTLADQETYQHFEKEYLQLRKLFWSEPPVFQQIIQEIAELSQKF